MKKLFMAGMMLALAGAAVAQVDPAKTVVVVNGEEIKAAEYYHRMEYLPGVGKQVGTSFVQLPPGFLTIEQLVTERLLLQLAKQKGVYPTAPEVEAEIASQKAANPKLLDEWLATGRSKDEFEYQVRLQLAQFKVATFGVNVTDQEIEAYYAKNPNEFTAPKQAKLRVIAVKTAEETKAVDADLAAGKAFADVAKTRSQDLTKSTGGDIGYIPLGGFKDPAVQSAIASTKIGQTTQWIPEGDAKVKFLVEEIKAAYKQPLDAALKKEIRRRQMLTNGSIKNNVAEEMLKLRSTAKIDIKDKVFADAYKQYINRFMQGGGQ